MKDKLSAYITAERAIVNQTDIIVLFYFVT
jgi:hypothetical protein